MSARTLLHRFGFDATHVRLLTRTPNRVYRVHAADGRSFLLRFRGDDALTPAAARLQQRWLAAIARDTDVTAPLVIPLDGKPFQSDANHQAALFTWVAGRRAGGAQAFVTPARLHAVGVTVARLHQHAQRFRLASTTGVRRFDVHYFFSSDRSGLKPRDREVLSLLARRTRRAMSDLGESRERFGLIHGDLGPANWIFHRGDARPIDFDQFGVGYFVFDLIQVLWSHAMWPDYPRYRSALLAGYETIRTLADIERRHLERFESIPRIEWINRTLRAGDRAALDRWLPGTMKSLRKLAAPRP